jgi:hypothetical protein
MPQSTTPMPAAERRSQLTRVPRRAPIRLHGGRNRRRAGHDRRARARNLSRARSRDPLGGQSDRECPSGSISWRVHTRTRAASLLRRASDDPMKEREERRHGAAAKFVPPAPQARLGVTR